MYFNGKLLFFCKLLFTFITAYVNFSIKIKCTSKSNELKNKLKFILNFYPLMYIIILVHISAQLITWTYCFVKIEGQLLHLNVSNKVYNS